MAGGGAPQVLANALARVARYSLVLGAAGGLAQSSLYVVNGGERAVIFNRFTGVEETVRGEVRDDGDLSGSSCGGRSDADGVFFFLHRE